MSQAQVFQTLNEQLACIAEAGVPLEEGLRLIAREVRSRRLRSAIDQVVRDLESGQDPSAAFARQSALFPELYHQIMQVGVQTGRMSQVLLLFGRHLALVQRLKRQLWQASAYPLICFAMLLVIATFLALGPIPVLGAFTSPGFIRVYRPMPMSTTPSSSADLPFFVAQIILPAASLMPWICGSILALLVLWIPAWWLLGRMGKQAAVTDRILSRLPLLGPILRRSALARWCDVLHIAADAGVDLPQAITLAGRLVGWPRLTADCRDMTAALESGSTLRLPAGDTWRIIAPSDRLVLQMGAERNDLPAAARTLAEMYQREAESRAAAFSAILSPLLLLAVALLMLIVLASLMLPIVMLFQALS